SSPAATWVDRKLPKPLQTFVGLYGSWLERLRAAPHERGEQSRVRRSVGLLLLDALLLGAIAVGAALGAEPAAEAIVERAGIPEPVAVVAFIAVAVVVGAPFAVGLMRTSRALGVILAERALPRETDRLDYGAAARTAFIVALQVVILAAVVLPVAAIT